MIICSCARITDHDVELALVDLMTRPEAPLPTPGVVYRHLKEKMNCCSCAPLAVETIYAKMEELVLRGAICPYRGLSAREQLMRLRFRADRKSSGREPAKKSADCAD